MEQPWNASVTGRFHLLCCNARPWKEKFSNKPISQCQRELYNQLKYYFQKLHSFFLDFIYLKSREISGCLVQSPHCWGWARSLVAGSSIRTPTKAAGTWAIHPLLPWCPVGGSQGRELAGTCIQVTCIRDVSVPSYCANCYCSQNIHFHLNQRHFQLWGPWFPFLFQICGY